MNPEARAALDTIREMCAYGTVQVVCNDLEEIITRYERALEFFASEHSYQALCPIHDKNGKFVAWGESLVHKIGLQKAEEALNPHPEPEESER